jgi:serine/threonine protein phosphatase PrpC
MSVVSPRMPHVLRVEIGIASDRGRRASNEDYVASCLPRPEFSRQAIVAAVADGLGGYKGGREASETAVRAFIDGFFGLPKSLNAALAAGRALDAVNGWIATQRRVDPALAGMATTFTALILQGRSGHVAHVGDTRAYRFSQGRLQQLTTDHTIDTGEIALALSRAVGFEAGVRVDHSAFGLRAQDRFLICSDGVHGVLNPARLERLLASGVGAQETANLGIAAALKAGSTDNVSAVVVDILDLPPADEREIFRRIALLPLYDAPQPGMIVDDYRLDRIVADGPERRVFIAVDQASGDQLILAFPHRDPEGEAASRAAFVNEAWVAAKARCSWIGEILDLDPERQTRLYSAMPIYDGETLERRLRRETKMELAEGLRIARRLARTVAHLHRCGIVHRDIRPENVILLHDGGVRLVGLGRARAPQLEDFCGPETIAERGYAAPEVLAGESGNEGADLYALGVTIYRSFCGDYPYGDGELPPAKFQKPASLAERRPDLPGWLDHVLASAFALDPRDRYADVLEFAFEIENRSRRARPAVRRKAFYDRNPVLFWKAISAGLLAGLIYALMRR